MRRVFISSVVKGFESYRAAAREACDLLGDHPVMCETFGARPYASEVACTTEVEQSDVYILLMGERFGFEPTPGKSVTQQEFEAAAAAHKPILAFIQQGQKEPKQSAFQKIVDDYSAGFFRAEFSDPHSLTKAIVRGLSQLDQVRAAIPVVEFGRVIDDRISTANFSSHRTHHNPSLLFAHLPQPTRRVKIRDKPADLDELFSELCRLGLASLRDGFEPSCGARHRGLKSGGLQYASFDDGFVAISTPLNNPRSRDLSGMQFMFVDPNFVQQRAFGFGQHVAGGGGWFSMELQEMDNRWLGQPRQSAGGGVQMPMHRQNSEADRQLLIPAPENRLTAWVADVMDRFSRTFGPPRSNY